MSRKPLLVLLAALGLLALLAPAASAQRKLPIAVGIGDQHARMFDDPSFKRLKIKRVRYFIRWNAIDDPDQLRLADDFMAAARRAKVRVLIHPSTDVLVRAVDARRLGVRAAKLPSVRQYRRKVGALIKRYGGRRHDWGVFNEVNHDTQPTYRSPRRAAQFFLEMRKMCRGCTIVALDVLDQRGVERYVRRWFAALGSRRRSLARIIGIHNYSDTNRYRQRNRKKGEGTKAIIDTVERYNSRAQFWLTEAGALAKFGRSFPCSPNTRRSAERRQNRATTDFFRLIRQFRTDIKRAYWYNWHGTNCERDDRFDAGLVRPDGSTRPAYSNFRRQLRRFRR